MFERNWHFTDLGDAIDDVGDFVAELVAQVVERDERVFDDIVDEAGGDRSRVEVQVGEDLGDFDAVRDVLFARRALLPCVCAFSLNR